MLPHSHAHIHTCSTEFQPYIFQLFAQLLEIRPAPISAPYMSLFPFLLMPALWESNANVSPLVRLLQAYLEKGIESTISADQLQGMLGIFQKLISSKVCVSVC